MAKMMTKSAFTVGLLVMLLAVPALGASINKSIKIEAGGESSGATSVNGSISVGEDAVVSGNVKTVNGSIRIDASAKIQNATTVNGAVRVADKVHAENLSTVNGSITVGKTAAIDGRIKAVNGRITVAKGATITDSVSNVNGHINLVGAAVGGDVSTVSGDVSIVEGTVVSGNLIVEKPSNWGFVKSKSRQPRVVIGPDSKVIGVISLERKVELYISETASVGGVEGVMSMADAVRFSGANP